MICRYRCALRSQHLAGRLHTRCQRFRPAGASSRRYHDANHTNGPSSNASPQAIYNATHGTWLWPPAENDKPNG